MSYHQKRRSLPPVSGSASFVDAAASVSVSTFGARRLPEIKLLYGATQKPPVRGSAVDGEYRSSGRKSTRRHLRRRATSHVSRRRHRYPGARNDRETGLTSGQPSRRSRRKPSNLHKAHKEWWQSGEGRNDGNVVNWMGTHVWHSKRFHMRKLWGWSVPLKHINRGPRTSIRRLNQHDVLVQDATWAGQRLEVSCATFEALSSSLHRICPHLLPSDGSYASVLSGNTIREGVIYEPDQFPLGVIGPASWWIQAVIINETKLWRIQFSTHPAILSHLENALEGALSSVQDVVIEGPRRLVSGKIRLRGANATAVMHGALGLASDSSVKSAKYCYDWDSCICDMLHARLPHGTVLHVKTNAENGSTTRRKGVLREQDCTNYMEDTRKNIAGFDHRKDIMPHWSLDDNRVMLVSQSPCVPSSAPQNASVAGWDIICRPAVAKEFFSALVGYGGTVVVGLAEELHARMESEPPLPVFPRDYPDSVEGRRYWLRDSYDWSVVRECVEKTEKCSLNSLNQVRRDKDRNVLAAHEIEPVVVVRGEFGLPFQRALSTSALAVIHEKKPLNGGDSTRCVRRPSRPTRDPSKCVNTAPLATGQSVQHRNMCKMLMNSLTLPAFLRCQLVSQDRGTIAPGNLIYAQSVSFDNILLGVAVDGCFSLTRGRSHGTGFLGASKLLEFLSEPNASTAVVSLPNGSCRIELKVVVYKHQGQGRIKGCISTASLLLQEV